MRLLVLEACQSPQSILSERKKASTDIDSFQPSSNVNKPLMLTSALPLSCAFIIYYLYNQMNKIRIQNKDYCDFYSFFLNYFPIIIILSFYYFYYSFREN